MTPTSLIDLALEVQRLPYRWPAPPDAASTERAGAGTCAGKHALLAQRLDALGISSVPLLVVGPLAPPLWPDLVAAAGGLVEVHECLTVLTSWAGPLIVDVTWHPAAVAAGLPGLDPDWDGHSDTPTAVTPHGPGWAVDRLHLRERKERLRGRLYGDGQRERRDQILAEIARRASEL
ncbi:hypothetical protein [Nocardioides aurantiacus]|uniref:Transglutaminase superfamily protein n=1 Tax=Nocardioides aurantiacus TaxID=86796 RepID=A0A3N2CUZ6_9ACTN|nr:hypothetical protein [Nocardioides aurantiacus]ROR91044.1 hypothetical protein EDD33_1904 [Nocardioides aurantiacus]